MKRKFMKGKVTFIIVISIFTMLMSTSYAEVRPLIYTDNVISYRYEEWFVESIGGSFLESTSYSYMDITYANGYELTSVDLIRSERISYDPESGDARWKYTYKYYYRTW